MQNKKTIWILMFLIMMSIAFAETDIFHTAIATNNDTTYRQQASIYYTTESMDSVRGGEGINFYIDYKCEDSLQNYNLKYIDHIINNITLNFLYTTARTNPNGTTTFSTPIAKKINISSDMDMPFPSYKEFYTIYDKESLIVYLDTNFYNQVHFNWDTICRFDIVFGTEGCNNCAEVEYLDFVQDVKEGNVIYDYNKNIWDKIEELVFYHYQFAIILYWIIIITILLSVIGIMLYIVMWAYHLIVHFFKKK
jgi:hypothetical protein